MGKPPADADPEKFVIGRGWYGNLRTARPYWDDRVFRIDPTPMPVWSIIVHNILFAAFFLGICWLLRHGKARDDPSVVWGMVAVIGIGLMTCIVFTLVVYFSFARARRLGPWLVCDKATRRVELPREGVVFERDEIVHLQYVTTKRVDWGGVLNNDQLSELNLITCRDGERRRWPLLRSIFNVRAFEYIVKPLVEQTDLPVVRVKDRWLGWEITETPFGRREREVRR